MKMMILANIRMKIKMIRGIAAKIVKAEQVFCRFGGRAAKSKLQTAGYDSSTPN